MRSSNFPQPLILVSGLQRALAAITRNVEADHPNFAVLAGTFHRGRCCSTLLRPVANLLVIRQYSAPTMSLLVPPPPLLTREFPRRLRCEVALEVFSRPSHISYDAGNSPA